MIPDICKAAELSFPFTTPGPLLHSLKCTDLYLVCQNHLWYARASASMHGRFLLEAAPEKPSCHKNKYWNSQLGGIVRTLNSRLSSPFIPLHLAPHLSTDYLTYSLTYSLALLNLHLLLFPHPI